MTGRKAEEKKGKGTADRRQGIGKRLRARFDDTTEGNDSVVLRGRNGATVYGCRRILCYEPERILLRTVKDTVTVRGSGLYCISFSAGNVTVGGEIVSVCYGESLSGEDGGGDGR